MDTARIDITPFVTATAAVAVVEVMLARTASSLGVPYLAALCGARLAELLLVVAAVSLTGDGVRCLGLAPGTLAHGAARGLLWSAGFGAAALCAAALLVLLHVDPLRLIRVAMPARGLDMALMFVVGGGVAPVVEEVFFRGLIYGFVRRWGPVPALIVSTALFVLAHSSLRAFPVIQAVGGVVFALSYEREGSLVTPITLHVLGNLALFGLSGFSCLCG